MAVKVDSAYNQESEERKTITMVSSFQVHAMLSNVGSCSGRVYKRQRFTLLFYKSVGVHYTWEH